MTTRRRAGILLGLALALVVLGASPAFAHAELESSDPQPQGVYDVPPDDVTLQFSEPVEASLGAVRVYDDRGQRLDAGNPSHPDGNGSVVAASLPGLDDGSYVVTWRVTSADGHPVQGAFTFQVGPEASSADLESLAQRLLANQGGSTTVGAVYAVDRFVVFAALIVLVGGAAFLVLVWPAGRESRRASTIVGVAWAAAFFGTLAGFALEGLYAAGLPLSDAFDPDLLSDVADTRFGRVSLARLVLLLLAVPLLRLLLDRRPVVEYPLPRWWTGAAAIVGLGLVATPGLAGHASSGDHVALAVVADTVHVGALSLWLGGLLVLLVALLPRADVDTLRVAVPRFSTLALASVVAIVVSGSFQAWRQVGSLGNLRDTDYGRLLVIKLLAVGALVVAAAFSREVVNRRFRAPPARVSEPVRVSGGGDDVATASGAGDAELDRLEVRNLRRSVFIEVLIAVVILGVTALLVNSPPARSASLEPSVVTLQAEELWVEVRATPGRAGVNDLHVTALTTSGGPTDVLELTTTLTLPDRDIAPIDVPLRRLGPGHYVAYGFSIPISGDWEVAVQALVSATDQVTLTGDLGIT